ncbi:uncharacterized protein LOC143024141 isoform X1 [Oratosquilla oratoria]|uniref:uncharacterized protein LOC143024141 isoform X1 n=1 Tax=Oratosquilla oratoria TaxID=337810 RepID=UPI003F75925A
MNLFMFIIIPSFLWEKMWEFRFPCVKNSFVQMLPGSGGGRFFPSITPDKTIFLYYMTTKFGKKRSSLDHTYAAIESSQEVNNMDMTLPQSRNNENCEGSSMRETPTQGVGEVKDWAEIAENSNDSVNNAGSRAQRMKVSGTFEDQAKSATTKDPLMTAIEAPGMDQDLIIEENNSADTKAADVNQDIVVGDNNTTVSTRIPVAKTTDGWEKSKATTPRSSIRTY